LRLNRKDTTRIRRREPRIPKILDCHDRLRGWEDPTRERSWPLAQTRAAGSGQRRRCSSAGWRWRRLPRPASWGARERKIPPAKGR
jgi:hypothetical protein